MKLYCRREELLQALSALSRVVPLRPSSPILSGCLFFTSDDMLVIQGTDLDLSLTLKVPAEILEEGSTVVPTRHFLDLLRRLPEGSIGMEWNEAVNRLEVFYKERASVKLNTWPASDFPSIHPRALGNSISFEGGLWRNLIKRVIFSAAPREIRPSYAGVYFEIRGDHLNLVSTDTYRLSLLRLPYTFDGDHGDSGLLIPSQAINETVRLVGDEERLEITWDRRVASFQTERFILTTRLIEAQFPAYEMVIPKAAEMDVYVDKESLESCLERAALFIAPNEHFAVTEMRVGNGLMSISAEASQVGSLYEELAVDGVGDRECVAFFNTRFLLEPLKAIDQQRVRLCLNGSGGPLLYLEDCEFSYLHLVLPVRRAELEEPV